MPDYRCANCHAAVTTRLKTCWRCRRDLPWKEELEAKADAKKAAARIVPSTVTTLAGIAWVIAAAIIGYLALMQYQQALLFPGEGWEGTAAWNGVAAGLSAALGGWMLIRPSRPWLRMSTIWAGLTVAGTVAQVSQGAVSELLLLATVITGTAGVLALVAVLQPREQHA